MQLWFLFTRNFGAMVTLYSMPEPVVYCTLFSLYGFLEDNESIVSVCQDEVKNNRVLIMSIRRESMIICAIDYGKKKKKKNFVDSGISVQKCSFSLPLYCPSEEKKLMMYLMLHCC